MVMASAMVTLALACNEFPGLMPQQKNLLDGITDCQILRDFRDRAEGTATIAKLADDDYRARQTGAAAAYAEKRMHEAGCQ